MTNEAHMNITICGSGNVGRALGEGWKKAGHSVTFAARDAAGAKVAELKKEGYAVAPQAEAANSADVIVLATPWDATAATIKALGNLAGKIVVDATNPLTAKLELALGFYDSAGETVARLASGAKVVKGFNTTGANNMANSAYGGGKLMMPIAGDDADGTCVRSRFRADRRGAAINEPPSSPPRCSGSSSLTRRDSAANFGFALLKR
jgi:predicted dinucleotide-binding enzyme